MPQKVAQISKKLSKNYVKRISTDYISFELRGLQIGSIFRIVKADAETTLLSKFFVLALV